MDNPRLPYLSDKAHGLPLLPGVYIMKNKAGDIIYIGKAKALKNRVSSYFRSVEKHLPKVYRMVSQVFDFDYIVTDSEFEALVLECSMIKLHTPKYNILLKDDKGYSYIKIFPKEYSRIRQTFQREEDGAEYIGPYPRPMWSRRRSTRQTGCSCCPPAQNGSRRSSGRGAPA